MNKKKTENYLDWLHKLRKEKSKMSIHDRLANYTLMRATEQRALKKAA